MGRKIPAKKHKGVKDPVKQQARRLQSLKGKINLPPSDPDDQPIPKSVERLFGLKPKADNTDKKKKHFNKKEAGGSDDGGAGRAKSAVSRLRRAAGESARAFSARISSAVRALVQDPAAMHYPVETEKDDDGRAQQVAEWKERRRNKRRQRGDAGEGATAGEGGSKKPHRLDLKKAARKAKAEERAAAARELQYERVGFGEVAAAPPARLPAPRATPPANKPGCRDLLLTKLLNPSASAPVPPSTNSGKKRPILSAVEKERRERARQLAVDAYRQLKRARERRHDS